MEMTMEAYMAMPERQPKRDSHMSEESGGSITEQCKDQASYQKALHFNVCKYAMRTGLGRADTEFMAASNHAERMTKNAIETLGFDTKPRSVSGLQVSDRSAKPDRRNSFWM